MTTLIGNTENKGSLLATAIVDAISGFFSSWGKAITMARACQANRETAYLLQHEYPDLHVDAIAQMLNDRIRKEVYGD